MSSSPIPGSSTPPVFLWVTCHVGAEPVLRAALAAVGDWRPAFARPGLVTFKWSGRGGPPEPLPRPHPLVRNWGLSLGRATTPEQVASLLTEGPIPVLHVQAGEAGPPGQVPASVAEQWAHGAREVEASLVSLLGARVRTGAAAVGDRVVDVVVRPGEPWLVGEHTHDRRRGPLAGGSFPLTPPPDAPSRAWAKLEELCAWSGLSPGRGQTVLEVGAAPGGASVALLDRGARVVAVDPTPIALPARVAAAPFEQRVKVIEAVQRDELPEAVDWLVVDVSMAAPVAVHVVERLVPRYRRHLRGCLVTLKLNEWSLAERLPGLLGQLQRVGFSSVEAANLASFRQEVGVVAR